MTEGDFKRPTPYCVFLRYYE